MERSEKHQEENITMICSYCRRIINTPRVLKNKKGNQQEHNSSRKSHGICPDCLLENYPDECRVIQEKMIDRIKKIIEGHKPRRKEQVV